MRYSYVSHLECPKCDLIYRKDEVHHLCECGSPLLVRYDLEALGRDIKPDALVEREQNLWRYHEWLPVEDTANVVSLGEGMTPLVPMAKLGKEIGLFHLYMKDEGMVPSGSFKARGAAVGISKAKELGVEEIAMPTNGNAGAAWSLYAARAGIKATIVMPVDAPEITRRECVVAGANLHLIDGLISDAGKTVAQAVKDFGLYDASTLKEPYRIEGKKTMGLELAEQMNWAMPNVILYPTGGGVGLIGIYKALLELKEMGWIEGNLPRLVAVQSTGCAPIVQAWQDKKSSSDYWENSETQAFGINVPKAIGDFLVLDAIYQTNGCAVAIDDQTMLKELHTIAQIEGAFICPEGAAAFAAARELKNKAWIGEEETVVVLNTGQGIKYPDTVESHPPVLKKGEPLTRP
ncbi:threonine synthase [Alkalicoccobacillus murimartini]|uniref:Threonine synthase n=1 Tax=Alkalicoccobacillus murimartini TaxID=171685 RepID=A0ABT9YJT2_9BACI|nr:threonine synthase [Alkalicoccobacillus murimartini]MDQ0207781.1 threonine synthase [Alkalicoccobacillus murimartini]